MATTYRIQEWKGKSGEEERLEAVDRYQQLKNVAAVARVMDRNDNTIRRWLKEAGVEIDPNPLKKSKNAQQQIRELQEENSRLRNALMSIQDCIGTLLYGQDIFDPSQDF